jgi:hypothetical protein
MDMKMESLAFVIAGRRYLKRKYIAHSETWTHRQTRRNSHSSIKHAHSQKGDKERDRERERES